VRLDEGRLSICTTIFVHYRDSSYKREWTRLNDRTAFAKAVDPGNRWSERTVAGMTNAMLAVMRDPDRDAREANVPRLRVADDGTLDVGLGFGRILALYYCSSALYQIH
jgi:hypothetical protein